LLVFFTPYNTYTQTTNPTQVPADQFCYSFTKAIIVNWWGSERFVFWATSDLCSKRDDAKHRLASFYTALVEFFLGQIG
jgi:hypothetical protein